MWVCRVYRLLEFITLGASSSTEGEVGLQSYKLTRVEWCHCQGHVNDEVRWVYKVTSLQG